MTEEISLPHECVTMAALKRMISLFAHFWIAARWCVGLSMYGRIGFQTYLRFAFEVVKNVLVYGLLFTLHFSATFETV